MKRLWFIVVLLLALVFVSCEKEYVDTVSSDESSRTSSNTSRIVKKDRQELLKKGFVFETDFEDKFAMLASPDTITYDSVYNELISNDKQYIIVTGTVVNTKSQQKGPDSGFSMTRIKVSKVHEANPKDIVKADDNVFAIECYYVDLGAGKDEKTLVKLAEPYEDWYYSPMLVEDKEYIFLLADKRILDDRTLNMADPGDNYLWYCHAAISLDYEYIEQYPEDITTEELIKMYAEGKIAKTTFAYDIHKTVLEKFGD